jgi:hypothetical protein
MRNHPIFFFLPSFAATLAIRFYFFSSLTKGEAEGSLAILCFSFFSFIKAEAVGAVLMQFFILFYFLSTAP